MWPLPSPRLSLVGVYCPWEPPRVLTGVFTACPELKPRLSDELESFVRPGVVRPCEPPSSISWAFSKSLIFLVARRRHVRKQAAKSVQERAAPEATRGRRRAGGAEGRAVAQMIHSRGRRCSGEGRCRGVFCRGGRAAQR